MMDYTKIFYPIGLRWINAMASADADLMVAFLHRLHRQGAVDSDDLRGADHTCSIASTHMLVRVYNTMGGATRITLSDTGREMLQYIDNALMAEDPPY